MIPQTLPLPNGEEVWRRIPWTEDLEFSNLCRMRRPSPDKRRDGYYYYKLNGNGNSYRFLDWYHRKQMIPWRRLIVAMFPELYDAYLANLNAEDRKRREAFVELQIENQRRKAREQYPAAYDRAAKIRQAYAVNNKLSTQGLACEHGISRTAVWLILRNQLNYDADYTPPPNLKK